tara:strand:+ start:78 stop:194 length:117 start_codon:yes stop_codon:yes gene_type:complete
MLFNIIMENKDKTDSFETFGEEETKSNLKYKRTELVSY